MAGPIVFFVGIFLFIGITNGQTSTTQGPGCSEPCSTCKTFNDGKYKGTWNLVSNSSQRCPGSCLYHKDGNDMCFCDPGTVKYEICHKDGSCDNKVSENSRTPANYYSFFCILGGCAPPLVCCTPLCLPICPIATPGIAGSTAVIRNEEDQKEDYPNYGKYLTTSVAVVHNEISNVNCSKLQDLREFQAKFSECGYLQYGKCLITAYNGYKQCKKEKPNASIKEIVICLGQKLLKDSSCKACAQRLVNAACCHFDKHVSCCSPIYNACSCSIGICIFGICIGRLASNETELEIGTTTATTETEIVITTGAVTQYYASLCFLGGCGPGLKCCVAICLESCPLKSPLVHTNYISDKKANGVSIVGQYSNFTKEAYLLFDKEVLELDNCTSLKEFKNSSEKCNLKQVTDSFPSVLNEIYYCVNQTFTDLSDITKKELEAKFYGCLGQKIYTHPVHKKCGDRLLKTSCCHLIGGKCCPDSKPGETDDTCCSIVDGYKSEFNVPPINCDCSYHGFPSGGCAILPAPSTPDGYTCHCSYDGGWTCSGYPIQCKEGQNCPANCANKDCCILGGGDCGGY